MSNVGFAQDVLLAYVSSPLKIVVDLSKTEMDSCIGASGSAAQPAPTATVAGSVNPGTNQLATFASTTTGFPELENAGTIWHCSWVRITEPSEGQSTKSSDGTRLWLPLRRCTSV